MFYEKSNSDSFCNCLEPLGTTVVTWTAAPTVRATRVLSAKVFGTLDEMEQSVLPANYLMC